MPVAKFDIDSDIMATVGAIVLGGGRGTRLYPLTAMRAKPAVPLMGRYRLVDIPLSQCLHSGLKRMVVLTQFQSASLHRHIQNSYQFDHFSKGFVDILAADQTLENGDWYQGTADAVRKQLRHVRGLMAEHYLILSGDHLYRMNYRKLMKTHLEKNADITVATLPVAREKASQFGIMSVSSSGRIKDFVEKPVDPEVLDKFATPPAIFEKSGVDSLGKDLLASMGVYLFKRDVLEEILEKRQDWIDFGKHVIPYSLKSHNAVAHMFAGFWEDIGTVRSYYDVHMKMAGPNPPVEMFTSDGIIYTHPRYLPGSRFLDVRITDSIICEGCRITKATIAGSIVGIRGLVGSGATVERTVVMGADYIEEENTDAIPIGIGAGSTVANAIVDKNARIGKNVVIRGSKKLKNCDREGFAVRDGIVVVLKNARIPNGTRIE